MTRAQNLKNWLETKSTKYDLDLNNISNASTDASFRSYFRIPSGSHKTLIAMDAPPSHENTQAFIHAGTLLQSVGINTPKILEQDLEQGFLIISDLGQHTYYQLIQDKIDDAQLQTMYRQALDSLVQMQASSTNGLPHYNQELLLSELNLYTQWYVEQHKQIKLSQEQKAVLESAFQSITQHNAKSPQVFVHRDFHSPNLIVNYETENYANPGIIDYQDALLGPITYDIASLVMDARTTWTEGQQLDWAIRYWQKARDAKLPVPEDFAQFHIDYEWMSLQRNLRILGVFTRLSIRDGKHHYLDHIPRVLEYIRQVSTRYNELARLNMLINQIEGIEIKAGYTF